MKRVWDGEIIELKPCPHCGADVAEFADCEELECCRHFERCPAPLRYVAVVCSWIAGGCGATGGFAEDPAEAAEKWNRRA